MTILDEGIRKAAMWAPIQFKWDRPNEDLRLPSVIIFKDNVCEMKIRVFNLKDIFNIISLRSHLLLSGICVVVNDQNFKAGGAFFCALKTKKILSTNYHYGNPSTRFSVEP